MSDIVEIGSGKVRGTSRNGVLRFTGIPYGADTSGENRFRRARPPKPWAGERDAGAFGPIALQVTAHDDVVASDARSSEDCLVLNVWTTASTRNAPVLFWIHGGGFFQGSGDSPSTDGTPLAQTGEAVVVSFNHRLGIFGFLDLASFGEDEAGSGNVGLLDIVLALEWVRDNISAFGGDPGRVHIFGHSGGGAKVASIVAMPAARGLFHTAAIHGGPPLGFHNSDQAARIAQSTLAAAGVTPDPAGIRALRKLTGHEVMNLQNRLAGALPLVTGATNFTPVVGRPELPEMPEDHIALGGARDIPLLFGTALDEARFALFWPSYPATSWDLEDAKLVRQVASGLDDSSAAEELVRRYKRLAPGVGNSDLLFAILSDAFRIRTYRMARSRVARSQESTYLYLAELNQASPYGAYHGFDMPLFFNTTAASRTPVTPEFNARAREVSSALIAFAASGKLTHDGIEWPSIGAQPIEHVVLAESGIRFEPSPLVERLEAWDGIVATGYRDPWLTLFLDAPGA